ncbi:MAG: hypothetical protein ABSA23_02700 [Anaerolineales bacterium]
MDKRTRSNESWLPAEPDIEISVPGHIFYGEIRNLFDGNAHLDGSLPLACWPDSPSVFW